MSKVSTSFELDELTEINGSPHFRETAAGWTCTRQFLTGGDRLDKEYYYKKVFPQIGTKIKTPNNKEIELHTIDITNKNKTHLLVVMEYGGDTRKNGVPEFSIDDGTLEKPIEHHKKYLALWNHALLVKNNTNFDVEFAQTAKTTKLDDEKSKVYKWVKDDMPVEEGWYKLLDPAKPNIESYIVPAPIIRETTYYRKLDVLMKVADLKTGVIKTPATPLAAIIGGEYLINSMSLSFDGKWWQLSRSYQYADKWDTDLYEKISDPA